MRAKIVADLNFGGAVKGGKGYHDTWIKILSQIPGVSENKAIAIARQYPTFQSLYSVYRHSEPDVADNLLVGINVSTASYSAKEMRIGAAISKKVCQMLLSEDGKLASAV